MARPPLRSTPPSPYRYLGRGGGERPVRVQVFIALVAGLVLVAVPLYLWRTPQPQSFPSADAAPALTASGTLPEGFTFPFGFPGPSVGAPGASAAAPPEPEGPQLEISAVKTLKCQNPGPGRTPPERCDSIRFFEESLVRAIKESQGCAPAAKSSYVVSYVLEFHFGKKRTSLYLGKSTTLAKSKRKDLLRCVERAMKTPDWDRINHSHVKYVVNTIATYPPSESF